MSGPFERLEDRLGHIFDGIDQGAFSFERIASSHGLELEGVRGVQPNPTSTFINCEPGNDPWLKYPRGATPLQLYGNVRRRNERDEGKQRPPKFCKSAIVKEGLVSFIMMEDNVVDNMAARKGQGINHH